MLFVLYLCFCIFIINRFVLVHKCVSLLNLCKLSLYLSIKDLAPEYRDVQ